MSGTKQRSTPAEPDPPPGGELAPLLWVLALLIAAIELAWWFFDRMYSA